MPLPSRSFSGSNFFFDIRVEMDKNRGMFAGADSALRFVCMDASFYRLEIFERPSSKTFTDAATALAASSSDTRVIASGQIYGTTKLDYCFSSPCPVKWQGEIIAAHVPKSGNPPSNPIHFHLGQWDGRSEIAFQIALGDPSKVTSPATYNHALGSLIPIVTQRIPFGSKPIIAAGKFTQKQLFVGTHWPSKPPETGKMVFGIHRGAQVVFVLAQEDDTKPGLVFTDLATRLTSMGVDDAAGGDWSNTATVVIDGSIEVTPAPYKDKSTPTGVVFRLQRLSLKPSSKLTPNSMTTDPQFSASPIISGTTGTIEQTTAGIKIDITALGSSSGGTSASLASALGVTLPLTLTTPSSLLTAGTHFTGLNTSANLVLLPTALTDGSLGGNLTITTSGGQAVFDVDWPVVGI